MSTSSFSESRKVARSFNIEQPKANTNHFGHSALIKHFTRKLCNTSTSVGQMHKAPYEMTEVGYKTSEGKVSASNTHSCRDFVFRDLFAA